MRPRRPGSPPERADRPRRWRPTVAEDEPGSARGGDLRAGAPGLLLGAAGGALANALLGGASAGMQAMSAVLGLVVSAFAFRAIGASADRMSARDLRVIAGVIGAGAVILVGRMLG